ncbi:MAG TPA: group I intron-associated PD-(D/E)XK endonuclease [Verrucomicrobiae bacterium]|jgi:hypothetical protein|nr:group I intron-associated PD-(D/E)XK endonuclease [Verrucomicrobiae bacterium]
MGMEFVVDRIMAVADDDWEAQKRKNKREAAARRRRYAEWRATRKPPRQFSPKRVGEIGELEFIQQAIRKGFRVSKPWGESDPYDAITDWKGRLLRVQVKATEAISKNQGYSVHASVLVKNKHIALTHRDIDVLAAYLVPEDAWYIVPVERFVPLKSLWFSPGNAKSRFEKFRDAWHWLKRKKKPKSRIGK